MVIQGTAEGFSKATGLWPYEGPEKVTTVYIPENSWISNIGNLKALHRPSTVNNNKTVLERRDKLLRSFQLRFDKFLSDLLRHQKIDEVNWEKIEWICRDKDFDFLTDFPKTNDSSKVSTLDINQAGNPLEQILFFSTHDLNLYRSRDLHLKAMDKMKTRELNRKIDRLHEKILRPPSSSRPVDPDLIKRLDEDFLMSCEQTKIPASLSSSYIETATQYTLKLLEIAKSKGLSFDEPVRSRHISDPGIGPSIYESIYALHLTQNTKIADWMIDNGARYREFMEANVPASSDKEISKLAFRLKDLIYSFLGDEPLGCRLPSKFLDDLEKHFIAAFDKKHSINFEEGGDAYDAVALLLQRHEVLPKEFVLKLLNYAADHDYKFSKFKSSDNSNLLYVMASSSCQRLVPEIVEFLIDQGINPKKHPEGYDSISKILKQRLTDAQEEGRAEDVELIQRSQAILKAK